MAQNSVPPTQVPSQKKEEPKKISLIALGSPPMPKFTIKDGKRQLEDMKDDGGYPPQALFVKNGKEFAIVPIALNTATQAFNFPKTNTALELFRLKGEGEGAQYEAFLKFGALPEFANFTVLVCRKTPQSSWYDAPRTCLLKNDLEAFPLRSVRAVNLSSTAVGVRIAGEWKKIGQGQTLLIPISGSDDFIVYDALFVAKDGKNTPLARSQALRVLAEDRTNLVFYDNDGPEMSERPVKLLNYPEYNGEGVDLVPVTKP